ncbi:phthiocerol/phthiodiolone dimycocerosyl transferase family protein [Haloechinothrix salitolerans]|uniref:Phthiocerol/phthiodiolone dimycocerosyl transferase n=1 Tax=Haloechinothrix salitolerans TaxID=926830 RepID=A0ABW2BY73_9PSEU
MPERYLDEIESQIDEPRTFALEYVGDVDDSALLKAFRSLCCNNPVLCGRIETSSCGKLLYTSPSHDVTIKSIDGDKGTLWQFAHSDWDSARAVAELAHIRKPGSGYIALRITHAIVDGAAFISYLVELLEHYTNIMDGLDTRVEPNPVLPKRPSDLIRERWESTQSFQSFSGPVASVSGVIFKSLKFSTSATSNVARWARLNKLSVNSFVGSAVALGLHRLKHSGCESLPVNVLYPVNLRRHVSPVVDPTESTNFVGLSIASFEISRASTVHSIARDFHAQIRSNTMNRNIAVPSREGMLSPQGLAPRVPLGLNFGLSGQGILPELQHPDELRYVDLLRPPPVRIRSNNDGEYVVYTFRGSLTIDLRLSDDVFEHAEASSLSGYIKEEIDRATTT